MENTIDRGFERSARAESKRPFLLFEGREILYRDFHARLLRVAEGFRRAGIGRGDRVVLLLGNVTDFPLSLFALFRLGATVVPCNQFLAPPEVRSLIERSEAAAMVCEAAFLSMIEGQPPPPKGLWIVGGEAEEAVPFDSLLADRAVGEDVPRPEPEDPALLLFTSGTEGKPRGVFLSHRNLVANVRQCTEALGPGRKDRFLLFLPLFHTFSLTVCLLLPALIGASVVLVRSTRNFPAIMKNEVLRKGVTFFIGVPAVFNAIAKKKIPFLFRKLNRIRVMISGSAPLSPATIVSVEKKLGAPLYEGYGLTEAGPVVSVNRKRNRLAGTVGPPLTGVEIRVMDESDREAPRGETGELLVRGENVARRFLGGENPLEDGWLRTGDLVSLDEENRITIHDRKKDLILVRGINVYPREVEEAIEEFPGVAAAAVVRMVDRKRGEVPRAFVQPEKQRTIDPDTIRAGLHGRIAPYKIPSLVEIVDDLPRGGTGKILRRLLADRPLPESPGEK